MQYKARTDAYGELIVDGTYPFDNRLNRYATIMSITKEVAYLMMGADSTYKLLNKGFHFIPRREFDYEFEQYLKDSEKREPIFESREKYSTPKMVAVYNHDGKYSLIERI